jgi:hypothetical protein
MKSRSRFGQLGRIEILLAWLVIFAAVPGMSMNSVASETSTSTNAAAVIGAELRLTVRQTGPNSFEIGRVKFDKALRTVSIPGKVRIRKEAVEYALVTEQGKAYESLLTTDARPADIHVAFLLLGMSLAPVEGAPNAPAAVPEGSAVKIEVSWMTNGQPQRVPLASLVRITSGRSDPTAPVMQVPKWLYNGSVLNAQGFAAQREGSIISLIRDPVALINNPGADRDNDEIHFPNAALLPADDVPVQVVMTLNRKEKE